MPQSKTATCTNWRSSTAAPSSRSPSPSAGKPTLIPSEAVDGLFAYWNASRVGSDSIFHQQPWIDNGSANHPVCIIGTTNNGAQATCLQVTSFDEKPLHLKYKDPNNTFRLQHMAIQGRNTVAPNRMPVSLLGIIAYAARTVSQPLESYVARCETFANLLIDPHTRKWSRNGKAIIRQAGLLLRDRDQVSRAFPRR